MFKRMMKNSCKLKKFSTDIKSWLNHASNDPKRVFLCEKVIDCIGDEIMIIDDQGRIIYVNQATVTAFKRAKKKLLGRSITEFFAKPMSIRQWKKVHLKPLKNSKGPLKFQIDRALDDGRHQIIEVNAVYTVLDRKGFVLSVARDITQQIETQKKLQESEDLYRLISEGAGDGIFVLDLKGYVIYGNQTFDQILGRSLKDYLGVHISHYLSPKSLRILKLCFKQARRGHRGIRDEMDLLDARNDTTSVEVNLSPLYRENKIFCYHVIVRDIRDRLNLEHMTRQAEKLNTMRFFVSGTVQEVINPMLGIQKRLEALLKVYKNRDYEYIGYKEYVNIFKSIEQIYGKICNCYNISKGLLGLSLKGSGLTQNLTSVNLGVQKIMSHKSDLLKSKNIKVHFSLAGGDPRIKMNEIDFNQIVVNLINNAIQAMPTGGLLKISTEVVKKDHVVIIRVKDNGVGIARDDLDHIFEPFYITQRYKNITASEGKMGLGLYIVNAIVEAHLGQAKIRSGPHKGTDVAVSIPCI